ncbi:hypothetical protein KIH39_21185 [Telmatocola sphagniphila]|uniref:Uncharacterized protein n=1 Tax=Telmatocola sphagniphila TaxID=1123043 RepID=A0A8E6B426_9BACT|nr:hypothetical protein [Telmatocola sphagniphila]QVL31336.1 hypothetical protein KIH39_21185 [Telmatocola sphagniphila]
MSEDNEFEIDPLFDRLDEIRSMESGALKIAAAEEAVRLADINGDRNLRYEARNLLVEAATFGGQPDLLLIHYPWMLAEYDAEPDDYSVEDLLWKFKWVVDALAAAPQISKDRVQAMLVEMKRRFDEHELGAHAYYQKRRDSSLHLGDLEMAREAHDMMKKTRRDMLSDCAACVPNNDFDYYLAIGDLEAALHAVKFVLTGKLKCAEVPHTTYGKILFPLLMLGRGEEAMNYHRKGYPMVRDNPGLLDTAVRHMAFLALTGNLDRAQTLLQRHISMLALITAADDRLDFYMQAWITLDRIVAGGKKELTLKVPADFPIANSTGIYVTSELKNWAEAEMKNLAAQYDVRNGNDYHARKIATVYEASQYAKPIPFKKMSEGEFGER